MRASIDTIEDIGRRTQQKLQTKEGERQNKIDREKGLSAMAKTHAGDKFWPQDGSPQNKDGSSFHTLKGISSADEKDFGAIKPQIEMGATTFSKDTPGQPLKRTELPEQFRESTITGFKSKLGSQVESQDVPSCFCEK